VIKPGGTYRSPQNRLSTTPWVGKTAVFIASTLFLAFFAIGQSFAYWSEPDQPAPDSSFGSPIIAGSAGDPSGALFQSKSGPLTIDGSLTVTSQTDTSILQSTDNVTIQTGSQLCLNGNCILAWGDFLSGYVHLSPASGDVGSIFVIGTGSEPSDSSRIVPLASLYGVQSNASEPTPATDTAAIVGKSFDAADAYDTYGAAGVAADVSYCSGGDHHACTVNSDCPGAGSCVANTTGVLGAGGGNAWAGRFDGRVGIEGDLCLNGVCRNVHTIGGPGTADGFVRVQQTASPEPQTGIVKVDGSFRSGDIVLGIPADHTSVLVTCGDGMCNYGNNGENNASCPADCS
jgi:hypothetical protein